MDLGVGNICSRMGFVYFWAFGTAGGFSGAAQREGPVLSVYSFDRYGQRILRRTEVVDSYV